MKKGMKKIIVISAAVIVVVAAVFIYRGVTSKAQQEEMFDVEPSYDTVTTGDITLSVSASGNLGSAQTIDMEADCYLVLDDVLVDDGDTVEAGQAIATLDMDAMRDYANELQTQINSTQTNIDTTNNVTTTLSIKSTADGWVKNVMLDEDEYIEDAMTEHGYIALVATEERERIDASQSGLAEGDEVRVKSEGYSHDGVVTSEDGGLYVSIDTIYRTVGADAVVYDTDGNELFTGQIALAAYDEIDSSYGIITDVNFSEDSEIEQGETIYKATQYSIDVKEQYESLASLKEDYNNVKALIEAGQIASTSAGVISSINIKDGQKYEADATLLSIESTDDWLATVAVDELDIHDIAVGQSVEVALDSLPDQVFSGEVISISDKGTASGGITTYDVDVSVEDNDGFKLAMTLNCEIMAQEATGALLVPIDDVRSSGNNSYVMVPVERSEQEISAIKQLILDNEFTGLSEYMGEDATALGIRMLSEPSELIYAEVRAVETGIQNAFYVEIISGVTEGESVLSPMASSDDDSQSVMMPGMGGMMQDMGGERPGGGQGGGRPGGN